MRQGLLILAALCLAAPAAAQDDEEDTDKKKAGDAPQGSLDAGEDPGETERVERGPYSPTAGARKVTRKGDDKAEAEPERARAPRKKVQIFGEVVYGWGGAPIAGPGSDRSTGDASGFVLMAGASYDFSPKFTLGLRVPWTTASFDERVGEPGTGALDANAFGAPELRAEYRIGLGKRTDLPIGLGVGIPVAQGNPDFTSGDNAAEQQAATNMFADAVTGWRDGELFMPERLPIVPFVGITYEGEKLDVRAFTKLVLAPDLGTEIRQPEEVSGSTVIGTYEAAGMALRSVTGAGVAYWFLDSPRLSGGLDAWAVVNAVEPVEFESRSASGPSPFQFVIEPKLAAMFGPVRPSLGYVLPIGGRLSDTDAQGLRLRLDIGF
jgi:hypothetical protein